MKLENGFWVDTNKNAWDCESYTEVEAKQLSKTLINCKGMLNCCHCNSCRYCASCSYCNDCKNCSRCSYCRSCECCHHCRECSECYNCTGCKFCIYCMSCSDCSFCESCRFCCDFQDNPQRIIGKRMGSRNDFPVVYWNEAGKEQCVVGCFRGTLLEPEKKVKERHKYNAKHYEDYIKFIKGVHEYQKATEGE